MQPPSLASYNCLCHRRGGSCGDRPPGAGERGGAQPEARKGRDDQHSTTTVVIASPQHIGDILCAINSKNVQNLSHTVHLLQTEPWPLTLTFRVQNVHLQCGHSRGPQSRKLESALESQQPSVTISEQSLHTNELEHLRVLQEVTLALQDRHQEVQLQQCIEQGILLKQLQYYEQQTMEFEEALQRTYYHCQTQAAASMAELLKTQREGFDAKIHTLMHQEEIQSIRTESSPEEQQEEIQSIRTESSPEEQQAAGRIAQREMYSTHFPSKIKKAFQLTLRLTELNKRSKVLRAQCDERERAKARVEAEHKLKTVKWRHRLESLRQERVMLLRKLDELEETLRETQLELQSVDAVHEVKDRESREDAALQMQELQELHQQLVEAQADQHRIVLERQQQRHEQEMHEIVAERLKVQLAHGNAQACHEVALESALAEQEKALESRYRAQAELHRQKQDRTIQAYEEAWEQELKNAALEREQMEKFVEHVGGAKDRDKLCQEDRAVRKAEARGKEKVLGAATMKQEMVEKTRVVEQAMVELQAKHDRERVSWAEQVQLLRHLLQEQEVQNRRIKQLQAKFDKPRSRYNQGRKHEEQAPMSSSIGT